MLASRLRTQNPIRWENYPSSISERMNRLRYIETRGKAEWVGRWFVQGTYPRGGFVKVTDRDSAVLSAGYHPGLHSGRKAECIRVALYGRLGNSRFRGCMYRDVVQPPFDCTWNPMWVAYEHTEARSMGCDSVSLPPDCTYVIRVRYANESGFESNALYKGGFRECAISQHRYYFFDSLICFRHHMSRISGIVFM